MGLNFQTIASLTSIIVSYSYHYIIIIQNMYFEAVEQIVKKLSDSKLKGSTRADLTKQLKELDPEGAIRAFLEGKTTRPDLSDMLSKRCQWNCVII